MGLARPCRGWAQSSPVAERHGWHPHIWMGSAGGAEGGKSQHSDYCHHPRPPSEMKSKQNSLYSCILPLSSWKISSHVDRLGNIVSLLF